MLVGEYNYAIDAKGRLNFPARFREEMGERFVVTRWLDGCLVAFSQSEFEQLAATFAAKGMTKSRDIQRFLFSAAEEVAPDKQGRILLPPVLRRHAGLEKEVTIIGNRNHAEIWDTRSWRAYNEQIVMDTQKLAATMEELDI